MNGRVADPPERVGRCLCGEIRYRITGKLPAIAYCHCKMCQRGSGSAFGCNVSVRLAQLTWLGGQEHIAEFESSPGTFRAFCSRCGSPLYKRFESDPEVRRIRLGTLDDDPGRRPFGHFWTDSKAAWYPITDGLPQHPEGTLRGAAQD